MSTSGYDSIVDSLNIRQVQNTDYQPNFETAVGRYSGGLDPQQINIIKGDPVISFTTTDLATVLAGISVTAGLALTSSGTITIPFQSRASGGTFLGSSSHKTLSATLGLLVPMELSASQGDKKGAQLKLELYPASSSGLANPVAMNTGATLASQAFVGGYDLGPVKIGSTLLTQLTSSKVMFGITVQRKQYNGEPWARISGITINLRDPIFEFTFEDEASLQSFDHYSALSTTCTAFFRQKTSGSTYTADASSAHIAMTLTNGIQVLQSASGSDSENSQFTRRVMGHTLSKSTSSAIS